jgi:ketosteroid isomerase-like protein
MRAMRALVLSLCLAACGSSSKPPPTNVPPPNPELSDALAPLAWWLGDWQAEKGTTGSEHWVASSGVIFGIALQDNAQFEVMVIDDGEGGGPADGKLRLFAMPGGMKSVELGDADLREGFAQFANPAHDDPKTITYTSAGASLVATIGGDGKSDSYAWRRITAPRAPELEAADVAFAKDTAARGIEGWVAAFEPKGGMMTKGGRVEGAEAIRGLMSELLATTKVEWSPFASAVRGDIGYTVGKATFTGKDSWRSTYVTIWKKQPDGTWKVLFDTGRTVNAR